MQSLQGQLGQRTAAWRLASQTAPACSLLSQAGLTLQHGPVMHSTGNVKPAVYMAVAAMVHSQNCAGQNAFALASKLVEMKSCDFQAIFAHQLTGAFVYVDSVKWAFML